MYRRRAKTRKNYVLEFIWKMSTVYLIMRILEKASAKKVFLNYSPRKLKKYVGTYYILLLYNDVIENTEITST